MREFQTIHRAGHLYVGKNDPNVFSRFQQLDGFVSVGSLKHAEPGFAEGFNEVQSNERFVFHDEQRRLRVHLDPISPRSISELGRIGCGNFLLKIGKSQLLGIEKVKRDSSASVLTSMVPSCARAISAAM